MAPIDINNQEIGSVTVNGTEVQEITVDGDVVFTAGVNRPSADSYWDFSAQSISGNSVGDTILDVEGNNTLTVGGDEGVTNVSSFDAEYDEAIDHGNSFGDSGDLRAYLYNNNIGQGWLQSHTVAFWWKPGDPAGTDNESNSGVYKFDTQLGNYSSYSDGFGIQFSQKARDNGGNITTYSLNANSRFDFSINDGPKNGSNTWFYIVSRFDSGTRFNFRVYEEGQGLIGEYNDTSPPIGKSIGNDVTFVLTGGISSEDILGFFDEAGLWNRFLSDSEVDELYDTYGQ